MDVPGRYTNPRLTEPQAITALREAIRVRHNLQSTYVRTEHVEVSFDETVRWDGLVRLFEVNHRETDCCYAWCYQDGDKTKFVCILQIPPIDSATSAVYAAKAISLRS